MHIFHQKTFSKEQAISSFWTHQSEHTFRDSRVLYSCISDPNAYLVKSNAPISLSSRQNSVSRQMVVP